MRRDLHNSFQSCFSRLVWSLRLKCFFQELGTFVNVSIVRNQSRHLKLKVNLTLTKKKLKDLYLQCINSNILNCLSITFKNKWAVFNVKLSVGEVIVIIICGLQLPREPHRSTRLLQLTGSCQYGGIM